MENLIKWETKGFSNSSYKETPRQASKNSFLEKIAQVFKVELIMPKFKEFKLDRIKTKMVYR